MQQANNFFRLSNGHTLVTCLNQTEVIELDEAGKVVNEMKDLTFQPVARVAALKRLWASGGRKPPDWIKIGD